jgi:glycosyltransferase involved in cell wall biosynthesis
MPQFSIIIPTSDRVSLLEQCLRTVVGQHFSNWEVIVVDNGSCSNEVRQAVDGCNDSRVHYIEADHKYDRSVARNIGLNHSTGRYVCFVDDDDELSPEYLSSFQIWYENNRHKGNHILRCGYQINKRGVTTIGPIYEEKKHDNPAKFAAFHMCGIWTLCIPREYAVENQFPAGFPHWQDTHVILRLLCQFPMVQIPQNNYIYRIHDGRGSIEIKNDKTPHQRLSLHLAAIDDFFSKYSHLYSALLAGNTHRALIAEKYLQYATADLIYFDGKNSGEWFVLSLRHAVEPRLWKSYLVFLRFYTTKKLGCEIFML